MKQYILSTVFLEDLLKDKPKVVVLSTDIKAIYNELTKIINKDIIDFGIDEVEKTASEVICELLKNNKCITSNGRIMYIILEIGE